jgi:proline racemase
MRWAESVEESDERRHLRRREVFAVRRHIATSLQDLADELILGEPRGDVIECGSTLSAKASEPVAIAALLSLEDNCTLAFQW